MVGFRGPPQDHMILGNGFSCTQSIDVFSQFGDLAPTKILYGVILKVYGSEWTFTGVFTGCFCSFMDTDFSVTGFYRIFYGYGIQPFLLCILSIALSVASSLPMAILWLRAYTPSYLLP